MKGVLYHQMGFKQKLPIPVADWAVRTKHDRELRLYLVARALFYGQAGYFTRQHLKDLRIACQYINTKKTFDRHLQRTLDAGLISFDGTKYHFAGMEHLAPMVKEARGDSLSKWRRSSDVFSDLFTAPQSAWTASLLLSVKKALHRVNVARKRYIERQSDSGRRQRLAQKHAKDKSAVKEKDYGRLAYRYINTLQGPEIPLSRLSRLSRIGIREGMIEHHWACNAFVDGLNLRTYQDVADALPLLRRKGIVQETSRLFKAKYGDKAGQIRYLEDVTTWWKSSRTEVSCTRRRFFKGALEHSGVFSDSMSSLGLKNKGNVEYIDMPLEEYVKVSPFIPQDVKEIMLKDLYSNKYIEY